MILDLEPGKLLYFCFSVSLKVTRSFPLEFCGSSINMNFLLKATLGTYFLLELVNKGDIVSMEFDMLFQKMLMVLFIL